MDMKKIGRKAVNGAKDVVSLGVGVGTGLVVGTACMAIAPSEAPKAIAIGFKIGTYGFATTMGTVSMELAHQELDAAEEKFNKLAIHRNKKVKVEVIEEEKA